MIRIAFEILLIFLLTIANGIFAGSELAIVSARKVRLEQLVRQGSKNARLALKLANSPGDFLSSIQIGITLIGILSGAIGGATLSIQLEAFFDTVPRVAPYSEPLSIFIVVAVITYLSLVIGELVPKRIALNNPEQIACTVARPLRGLAIVTAPIVKLLSASSDGILKLLGIQASAEPVITEEEIRVLIEQGTQAGTFEESEQEMVSRVFRLGDRSIKSLMTPRTEVAWLDIDAPWEENLREIQAYPHSQYPVARDSLDDCLGIVRLKDLLATCLVGEAANLPQLLQTPLYVPESSRALNVLETFQASGTHIALITDEYGGIEGIVTLNDLVEAIIGEMPTIEEINEPQILQRDDGSWLLDGLLSTDTLKELLQQDSLPHEANAQYHTLGGFVVAMFERIPQSGEHFDALGFRFEVVDMDGTRVDKILVTPLAPEQSPFPLSSQP